MANDSIIEKLSFRLQQAVAWDGMSDPEIYVTDREWQEYLDHFPKNVVNAWKGLPKGILSFNGVELKRMH